MPIRYTTPEILNIVAPDNRAAAIVRLRRLRNGRGGTAAALTEGVHWHRVDGNTVHYTAAGLRLIKKIFGS